MAQPLFGTQGNAKVDKLLTQFSIRYTSESFLCDQILPVVKVEERTGLIPKYGKDNIRVFTGDIIRAPGTRAKGVEYTYGHGSYACKERSVEVQVPWEFYRNTDNPYNPTRDATATAKDIVATNKEWALAQAMGSTSVMTQNVTLSGTDKWSDTTNSSPIEDLVTGIKAIMAGGGRQANCLILSYNVYWALKVHPELREYLKYTNGGQLSDADLFGALKAITNVEEVLVGKSIANTAAPGQTDTISQIWANNAWLLYRPKSPRLMEPAFGYTLQDELDVVDGWGETWKKRDMIRDSVSFDQNIIDVNLGYLIKNAV